MSQINFSTTPAEIALEIAELQSLLDTLGALSSALNALNSPLSTLGIPTGFIGHSVEAINISSTRLTKMLEKLSNLQDAQPIIDVELNL